MEKSGGLMDASNDFILRNSLKLMKCLCMHWINDPVGGVGWMFIECAAFLFSFNWCFICSFVDGNCSPVHSLLWHTHRQNECLFNGLGASRVMISPESGPPRAKATQTTAKPQVGQHSTTELGRNSCPRPPGKCSQPTEWIAQVCVRHTTGPFNTSAVVPTADSLPPAALTLTTSLSSLYIHQEHFIHMIYWAMNPSETICLNWSALK